MQVPLGLGDRLLGVVEPLVEPGTGLVLPDADVLDRGPVEAKGRGAAGVAGDILLLGKVALEVDRDLIDRLRRRLPNVEVLEADARTWDYGLLQRPPGGRVLVVGNLPYSVGKPIVAALLEARAAIDAMALMLQREVAERLAAPPGGKVYGALSVLTQAVCDVDLALRVPPGAFRPPPQVESAVVRLTPRATSRVPPELDARFPEVVKAAFSSRRKTLANALAGGLGIPLGAAREAATTSGVDPGRRAETLDIEEFVALTARL